MKIQISMSKTAEKESVKVPQEEDSLNKEWQDFLTHVCQSIEDRRKLLKPSVYRPKKTKQGS